MNKTYLPQKWNEKALMAYYGELERVKVERLAMTLLPAVCHKHVFECNHERSLQMVDDREYLYISWTFFNDERVRMKAHVKYKHKHDLHELDEIKLIPICDDFEAWQADAIMRCEAGEDKWHRPEQKSFCFHK